MSRCRLALLCATALFLAGCGFPPPLSSEDREALDSCNADVNRTWDVQHRDELSIRTDRDAPYSGNTPPGLPSDNLSDEYAHNTMIADCLHGSTAVPLGNTSPTTDRAGTAPAAAPSHP